MSFQIIIKGKNKYGKTRVEQESNLRRDGYSGMSDENYDKAKHAERKYGIKNGFLRQTDLDKIK